MKLQGVSSTMRTSADFLRTSKVCSLKCWNLPEEWIWVSWLGDFRLDLPMLATANNCATWKTMVRTQTWLGTYLCRPGTWLRTVQLTLRWSQSKDFVQPLQTTNKSHRHPFISDVSIYLCSAVRVNVAHNCKKSSRVKILAMILSKTMSEVLHPASYHICFPRDPKPSKTWQDYDDFIYTGVCMTKWYSLQIHKYNIWTFRFSHEGMDWWVDRSRTAESVSRSLL